MPRSRPRTNGVGTATFRRPSVATSTAQSSLHQNHQVHGLNHVPSPGAYVPPHHYQNNASRNGVTTDSRFSKQQLLTLYKTQKESGELGKNIAHLFIGGWQPGSAASGNVSLWAQKDDPSKENGSAADICWDFDGGISPLGFVEMDEEEREVRYLTKLHRSIVWVLMAHSALHYIRQFAVKTSSSKCQQGANVCG